MIANTVAATLYSLFMIFRSAFGDPSTVINPGFGFSFIGCYNEIQNARALPDAVLLSTQTNMTVEVCAQFCSAYRFMGVEYGSECYCGDSVSNASREVTTESGLNCGNPAYACVGNANEMCGGYQAFDLYAQAGATTTAAVPLATGFVYVQDSFIMGSASNPSGDYNYIGCYNDPGSSTRALNGNYTAYGATNVEACADFCTGYTYFGLEDGGECFCGNTIGNGASAVQCQNECYQCCSSDATERCGGYFRLSMYELNGPNYTDPDPTAICTYNGPATVIPTGSSSYTYYGPITTGSTVAPVITTNSAGQTTSYTSTEYYCLGGICQSNPHTPGGSITATHYPSATPTPTDKPSVGGCTYVGCYDDNGGARTLTYLQAQLNASSMTLEACISACAGEGYLYAGAEYGEQCFCGSSIIPPHALVQPGSTTASGIVLTCSDPDYACTGDDTEQCGGFAAIDIYYCPQNAPRSSTASPPMSSGSMGISMSSAIGATSSASMGSMSMSSLFSGSSMSTSWNTWSGSACTKRTAVLPVSA